MKKLLLTFSMLIASVGAFAQYAHPIENYQKPAPRNELGQVVFSKIVELNGAPKTVIESAVKQYAFEANHKEGCNALFVDPDIGIIIFRDTHFAYRDFANEKGYTKIYMLIRMKAKEGKVKIDILNLEFQEKSYSGEIYTINANIHSGTSACVNPEGALNNGQFANYCRMFIDAALGKIDVLEKVIKHNTKEIATDW